MKGIKALNTLQWLEIGKNNPHLFSIILDPAFYPKVYLIQTFIISVLNM